MSELFSGVNRVSQALDYHLERHNVIVSNVANVDTPGFSPKELLRASESSAGGGLRMTATDEAHLGTAPPGSPGELIMTEDPTTNPGNDGNAVSLDREMSKLAANDIRYDTAAKIVSRQLGMLRYAVNGGMNI